MEVEITTRGDIPDEARERVTEKIGSLDRLIDNPIVSGRVVLTQKANPRMERPSIAEGEVHLNGPVIRAKVAEPDPVTAVNSLAQRLERQLRSFIDRRIDQERRTNAREISEARKTATAEGRPEFNTRAAEEREVVRRKAFAIVPLTPAEAAEEMALLDHDFYLFIDGETGADAVVYQRDDGQLGIIGPRGTGWAGERDGIALEESHFDRPLSLDEAATEMSIVNHRFMYFTDADSNRGNVIYMRHDGNYGLIEPAR